MFKEILNSSEQLEQMRVLRQLELQAYTGVINAFSAQGELTEKKRKLLKELQSSLSISIDRHKAEIRRALNDDTIESVSKVNGETRSEWIIEGKRSIPAKRRTIPDTYATKVANAKAKLALERPDLLRPKYKFFARKTSLKTVDMSDNLVDTETGSAVMENGGDTSTVEDDADSGTCPELQASNVSCKSDNDQSSNIHDNVKTDNLKERKSANDQETISSFVTYPNKETKQAPAPIQNTSDESLSNDTQEAHPVRPCVTSVVEPKPVISTVQSLYGKPVVFKQNVEPLNQPAGCIPNIKQVASTVTIGTSETSDVPVSSAPTTVSLQQSNLNLLKRQTNIIVVHRPSKLSQSSRIAIPQQSNNRSIRVIRQEVPLSSSQQIHSSSTTESRIGLNVSNANATHTYPGVLNVDLDSDAPSLPTLPQHTQIKPKTYIPTQTQSQTQQSLQIQQPSPGDVYHVPQVSGEARIIAPHSNIATYQKSDTSGYSSVEVRKLELQPVLRDQLQQTQKQQNQHQQQLLVLQAHVPQAQHQDQKPLQTRFIYTQTPSQSLQRTSSSSPPPSSQPQQLQIQLQQQLQIQRQQQQQHTSQSQQTAQSSQKQALSQQASVAHISQPTITPHQTQIIQQSQPQIQLQQTQPQIQLQSTTPQIQLQQTQSQIQLQQSQPIMLAQPIKTQQYQLSQSQPQQQSLSIEDQGTLKHSLPQGHQLKQESHQQQVLLLKGQLLQIQPISSDQTKSRPVASLINESSMSPNKRLKTETTNKRKLSESYSDWQAEMLPLISKLLDSCLLENLVPDGNKVGLQASDERGLIKQDTISDNQEKATLLRMKDSLMSRQYLNQQSFENDMHQLQASCLKKYATDDNRRVEMEEFFATFYRDLRILKQSSLETAEPPSKVKIYESG